MAFAEGAACDEEGDGEEGHAADEEFEVCGGWLAVLAGGGLFILL